MNELWKNIQGFEGYYQISNLGRIKTLKAGSRLKNKDGFLTPTITPNGYETVTLYASTRREKWLVHRLVAFHFIGNPNNFPHINHLDENKLNNKADNLEWCTVRHNNTYGTARLRQIDTSSKAVAQYSMDKKLIAVYRSSRIASELLGISRFNIRYACRNPQNTARGYYWAYLEDQSIFGKT